jgi:hypothetical protein
MAVITDIADAVAAELNAASFSQPFEAKRSYLPRFDLAEMKDLHVTVVPKAVEILPGTRAHNQHDFRIDVAVQKKLTAADNDQIDALMVLVEEIADHFRLKRLEGYSNVAWVKTENEPVYAQEHLDQLGQFTSVLTFTFRIMR